MEKQWYVVHTYSGYENKVMANLEKRLASMGMEDKIFRILVPEDEETEIKNGKKKVAKKKVFPGYVLAEMIMTDDSWYVVRNTPGVTGFVGSAGSGSKPTPLLPEEAETILKRMGMKENVIEIDYDIGDQVTVTDGAFIGREGVIKEIDADRQKVKVHVDMFGRETPVELDYQQVERMS
ncbi:transcription antitermination protein nusG [Streptohalobacillus salinus]|uniref:Transcription termination/antitermination protein NusG n=1 Tax=Streptohalobacillus salinus TaxID=621096 RepID=A0A2V3W1T7_9BACI|nr:transcription termination/antitermination protein NusG [Streptohalobacillus salinus]PXW87736.1 transcription antitermination protein nusG [Streptohalobacillus salinus]